VELHRRSVGAFSSLDAEGCVAPADPQVEIHSVFAAVGGGSYRGADLKDLCVSQSQLEPIHP
jgi:hypothetical protein